MPQDHGRQSRSHRSSAPDSKSSSRKHHERPAHRKRPTSTSPTRPPQPEPGPIPPKPSSKPATYSSTPDAYQPPLSTGSVNPAPYSYPENSTTNNGGYNSNPTDWTFQVCVNGKFVTATQSNLKECFVSEAVVSSLQLRPDTTQTVKYETGPGKSAKTNKFVYAEVKYKEKTEKLPLYVLRSKEIKHELCLSSIAYARLAPSQQLGSSILTYPNSSEPYDPYSPQPDLSTTADAQYGFRQTPNTSDAYPHYSQQGRSPATQGEVNKGGNYSQAPYQYQRDSYETTESTWDGYRSG
ncbi:hypothetical protein BP6252_03030 [Coleophoma cylindrospora]|uniref:Uncharacterized protein n=1 Tax=Coleophoma cylindrospora TaxID=1849047 RepID=A0A3D8S6L5_9HELO|nr:hypothetical protein BP6252_03030 [Coleophoma cylindrospora]